MRKIVFLMALLSSLAFANYELERQCNNGDAGSCFNLGILYNYGYDVKKKARQDSKELQEFYIKSCEVDYEHVYCVKGILHKFGNGVIKQDYKKAREFYGKACEMGEALGCVKLGNLYYNGYGIKQNYKKANEFSSKACEMGRATSCYTLGVTYKLGYSARQDSKKL